jgi:ribosomal protein S18 acetylase RimI-like enzyme
MTSYAPFDPAPVKRAAPLDVAVRDACDADVPAIAGLLRQRHSGEISAHAARIERVMRSGLELFCVAEHCDQVVAFGQSGRIEPPPDAPPNCVPAGFYLLGIIVNEPHRRRGVGAAVTRHRLSKLFALSDTVYYFTNENNLASIVFHRPFGFRELARNIWAPGVMFTGGAGVLFGAGAGRRNGAPS